MRLDANPEKHPDILAFVPPLPAHVLEHRWDVIEMNHFMASINFWDARELLKQVWQVLTPGGKLVIETPDIAFCMKHFLMKDTHAYFEKFEEPVSTTGSWQPGQLDMWGLWGNPATQDVKTSNKWGYTPGSLRQMLVECGFEEIHIHDRPAEYHVPVRDFRMEAYR